MKLSSKTIIVVSICMSDPMGMGDPNGNWRHESVFLCFFLYSELTSDVSQDSDSKFVCFHGHVQCGNRRSMFLNYSSS